MFTNIIGHRPITWNIQIPKGFWFIFFSFTDYGNFGNSLNLEHQFAGHCFLLSEEADPFVCFCLISKASLSWFPFKLLFYSAKSDVWESAPLHLDGFLWMEPPREIYCPLGCKAVQTFWALGCSLRPFHIRVNAMMIIAELGKTGSALSLSLSFRQQDQLP